MDPSSPPLTTDEIGSLYPGAGIFPQHLHPSIQHPTSAITSGTTIHNTGGSRPAPGQECQACPPRAPITRVSVGAVREPPLLHRNHLAFVPSHGIFARSILRAGRRRRAATKVVAWPSWP